MSLPNATVRLERPSLYTLEPNISDKRTICRLALGNSKPMQFFPGMVSTTRIEVSDKERARSRPKFTIWLPFTPTAGSTS